ncbi:MAG: excinuclease ABC subunit UvrA, partial [Oscillospiraceae bacterium]
KASGWYFGESGTIAQMYYEALAAHYKFSLDTPFKKLSQKICDIIFYGTQGERIKMTRKNEYGEGTYQTEFEGVANNLERRFRETQSNYIRDEIAQCMSTNLCPDCNGERLKKEILSVTVGNKNISDLCKFSITEAHEFIKGLELSSRDAMIAAQIVKEINERLSFLESVGLDYLTLSRSSGTLSGGESQRIRLATQIGSSLVGVLYILDEPSIGLHQKDNDKLILTLKRLRDLGNTLIVVEHDEDTMFAADYIVDIGPGAGV